MAALVVGGCGDADGDPLAKVDRRYAELLEDLGAADRDTTRNVHNKEARKRKSEVDRRKAAFFREQAVQDAIEAAARAPAGGALAIRGASYRRLMIVSRPWNDAETERESDLLGALDEAAAAEATWSSPDGSAKVPLARKWDEVSEAADRLTPLERHDLAAAFVRHRSGLAQSGLVELVKLRNEVARREGYANYWELALASQDLTPKEVDAAIDELSAVVAPLHRAAQEKVAAAAAAAGVEDDVANHPMLRRAAGLEVGREAADAVFDADRAEERIVRAYHDLGIDTRGLQVYTGPTRYVRPGVYGFVIRPPSATAVVMSVDERWSVWPYEALMHEVGHVVWWKNLAPADVASPALWEPPAPWFEGFAQFFERMVFEPAFAARYVPDLDEAGRQALRTARILKVADGITDAIVETRAERRLYESPDDIDGALKLAAETRSALTGSPPAPVSAEGRTWDPALFAGLLWHYPAYAQNYLFAYMAEAQLWQGVSAAVGEPVGNAKVGPFVVEKVVRAQATLAMPERLAAITPGERTAPLRAYLGVP
jgi:hypothetical protein